MSPRSHCFSLLLCLTLPGAARPEAPPPVNGGVVGRVVDTQGAAIPNAMLFVHLLDAHYAPPADWKPSARSGQDGSFFLLLTPGTYDVVIIARPFRAALRSVHVYPLQNTSALWRLRLAANFCSTPGTTCDSFGAPQGHHRKAHP